MKKFILPLLCAIAIPYTSYGALAPFYQSVREYQALLNDPKFAEILSNDGAVTSIERENNQFVIKTNNRKIKVSVVYDQQSMPGPVPFHFKFSQQQQQQDNIREIKIDLKKTNSPE